MRARVKLLLGLLLVLGGVGLSVWATLGLLRDGAGAPDEPMLAALGALAALLGAAGGGRLLHEGWRARESA